MLIILESTTYPGTTDELVLPMLEVRGLRVGEDFFLCFSPERVDPGNPKFQTVNIPKVVGGVTAACTQTGATFYRQALEKVIPVSSSKVAEMVKLLENTFRMINIGLANEMAMMCERMGINVWEVIEGAATKPFGFMPFYPGPWRSLHSHRPLLPPGRPSRPAIEARFIELAGYINGQMPHFVVKDIQNALNEHTKPLQELSRRLMGVAYKRDIDDVRESPALDIPHLLGRRGAWSAIAILLSPRLPRMVSACAASTPAPGVADAELRGDCDGSQELRLCGPGPQGPVDCGYRNALKGFESETIVRL